MCMIAWRPIKANGKTGAHIPNAVVDTAVTRHADGFGIAWREAGKLHVEKFGPASSAEFRALLKRVDLAGFEYVTHFRWATHGPKDRDHAHPFEYTDPDGERVVIFHNGIIDINTRAHESDTEVFVRDVLAKLPASWWDIPAYVYLVTEAIGWSKLVVMTRYETVSLQDKRGEWDGGIWYSSDHRPSKWRSGQTYSVGNYTCMHKRRYVDDCVDCGRSASMYSGKGKDTESKYISKGLVADPKGTSATGVTTALTVIEGDRPDEWDDVPDGVLLPLDGLRPLTVGGPRKLRHAGHTLSVLQDIRLDKDDEYEDAVICESCQTIGTLYVIDGQTYPDMAHLTGFASEVEDGEAARVVEGLVN